MIKIIVLNDNRCNDNNLECEHGLSLLIEDNNREMLLLNNENPII